MRLLLSFLFLCFIYSNAYAFVFFQKILIKGTVSQNTESYAVILNSPCASDAIILYDISLNGTFSNQSIIISLEHSPDGTTWLPLKDVEGNEIRHTVSDGNPFIGQQRLGHSGVLPYIRATADVEGTNPNFTVKVSFHSIEG